MVGHSETIHFSPDLSHLPRNRVERLAYGLLGHDRDSIRTQIPELRYCATRPPMPLVGLLPLGPLAGMLRLAFSDLV